MSSNVEAMFYAGREKPWHKLGVMVENALTSEEALVKSGLDWTVESKPIYDANGNEIHGYKMNVRSSDQSVLGVVSNRYSIVQNHEAFEFTDALVGEGITYETAGSLKGGKQIWLLGKMPERKILGDDFEPYICFTNTHDGTGAVRACMTPIRVVCNNTLNLALSTAARSWSTPHRGDIKSRLDEARQTLELADAYLDELAITADQLANEPMSNDDIIKALDVMIPVDDDMTDRQKNTAKDVRDQIMVCMFSPDLVNFLNTRWGFINAVSDYVGHGEPGRHTANYDENRWANLIAGRTLIDKAVTATAAL